MFSNEKHVFGMPFFLIKLSSYKIILKDATLTSWQFIILYAFFRLMNIIPYFNELVNPSKIQSNVFLGNGGDIFLICLVGYVVGASVSYFRHS